MPSDSARPFGSSGLGPGMVLDGKYEILNRLGVGGMGEVFKARHLHLNTFRCIKVMRQALLDDEGVRNRFLREARLATQIHHPNIAVVHDFFLGDGRSYMVTEFIDGTTVRQWSGAYGPFPLALAADVASQVLLGLDHIHRRGLLHRDISPDNVMLTYDSDDRFVAKIIDLGIAKDINTDSVPSDRTQAGVLIGNPKYMSPEQFGALEDNEQLDGRADLYCLGVVLYEMLLGVPPFVSETPQGYIMKHLTEKPRPFAKAKPGMVWSGGVEDVIFRVLEKDRRRRFSDAREFAAALERFTVVPPGTLTREVVSRLRRAPDQTMPAVAPVPQPRPGSDMPTVADMPLETATQRDWKKTIETNTVEAYRDYIARHPDAPETTEAKARFFELSLLDDVRARENEGNRDALQRLAEGHPPGSRVGDAARAALGRIIQSRQREQEEENAFQQAWENGRSSAWREFLDTYPNSRRADRARLLLEETVAFELAVEHESDTGLREFLKMWPDGRHHLEAEIRLVAAKQRAADDAFAQAVAADSYAAFRDFIARFPASSHVDDAKRLAAERLAFETATADDTEEAWEAYLAKWGGDAHAMEGRVRLERAKAREEEAYKAALEAKSVAAWEEFLAKHPHGKRNARAERNRREAVAFDEARAGGRAALQEFLRRFADGLLSKDAQRLLRQMQDAEDFEQAEAMNTPAAWQLYLSAHPGGARSGAARERLMALEDAAFAAVLAAKQPKKASEFLSDFPDSLRRDELRQLMAKWRETAAVQEALDAIAAGDADGAETLLRQIADGERHREIAEAIAAARDRASWEAAYATDSVASLQSYLDAWPNGRWVSEARKRLAKLQSEKEKTEPADWNAAWENGTVEAWDRYLAEHAASPRIAEARLCRQEASDFELAVATNTAAMWRAFLKTWPEGRHRIDAAIRSRYLSS
ncbi:MAG TPA: serine/threonine-protein kinase [Thermoanaerobaculia bacterium]|nr:serine/threonine-protein kinase [Thermoanaerobaculia bacterium]